MKMRRASRQVTAQANSFERDSEALSAITASRAHPREARSRATLLARSEVHRAEGLLGVTQCSAQVWVEATSMAVYCHAPRGAPQPSHVEAVHLQVVMDPTRNAWVLLAGWFPTARCGGGARSFRAVRDHPQGACPFVCVSGVAGSLF
jgi:hypothetical protein